MKRDVQSAYFGYTARESIIRAVGRMSLTRDPRVPKELSDEHKAAIDRDPRLVKMCGQQQCLAKIMKRKHGSIPKAKGTDLYREYTQLGNAIRNERQSLHRAAFGNVREEFFETIDTIEIERQLLGLSVSEEFKVEDKEDIQFTFEERARLARNLFRSSDCSAEDPRELHARRVQTIQDWATLCNLYEAPRLRGAPPVGRDLSIDIIVDADTFPILCPGTQCLFCLGDDQLPHTARTYSFSRSDHLRRHVQNSHLQHLAAGAFFFCPHPACLELLEDVKQFKDHANVAHNIYL